MLGKVKHNACLKSIETSKNWGNAQKHNRKYNKQILDHNSLKSIL